MKRFLLTGILLFTFSSFFAQTATGDLVDYVGDILDNAPGSTGNNYIIPDKFQIETWDNIIGFILEEDLTKARAEANTVNYQITGFTDTSITPNKIFYILEEKNPKMYYWGTYVFNKTPERNYLILQAPHSKYDTNTGREAVYCFKNIGARAVFINGTHRCNCNSYSSCSGTTGVCGSSGEAYRISDMAHTITSMFQKTTEKLFKEISNSVFIQLHGFAKRSSDPYVILSNGTRKTPQLDYAVMIADELLVQDNLLTSKIAHKDLNWNRLIAFTNTQGRLINNSPDFCKSSAITTSGRFIHIEQEKSRLRNDEKGWDKMSVALSKVFSTTLNVKNIDKENLIRIFPNPSNTVFSIQGEGIVHVDIFNVFGQKSGSFTNWEQKKIFTLDLNAKAKGIYFCRIHLNNNSIITKKMVHF